MKSLPALLIVICLPGYAGTASWDVDRFAPATTCTLRLVQTGARPDPRAVDPDDATSIYVFVRTVFKTPFASQARILDEALRTIWLMYVPGASEADVRAKIASLGFSRVAMEHLGPNSPPGQIDKARLRRAWDLFMIDFDGGTGPTAERLGRRRAAFVERARALPRRADDIVRLLMEANPEVGANAPGYLIRLWEATYAKYIGHPAPVFDLRPNDHRRIRRRRSNIQRELRFLCAFSIFLRDLTGESFPALCYPDGRRPTRSKYAQGVPTDFRDVPEDQPRVIIGFAMGFSRGVDPGAPGALTEYFRRMREAHGLSPHDDGFTPHAMNSSFYHQRRRAGAVVIRAWARFRAELLARDAIRSASELITDLRQRQRSNRPSHARSSSVRYAP